MQDIWDTGSIPRRGRFPGGRHGNSLQYSFLEDTMNRTWKAMVHRIAKSQTWLKRLSTHAGTVEVLRGTDEFSYSKSWKMMLWKCCTQYASKFGKLSSGHRTGKGQFSFQSQRNAMPKNAHTTAQLHSSHMQVK